MIYATPTAHAIGNLAARIALAQSRLAGQESQGTRVPSVDPDTEAARVVAAEAKHLGIGPLRLRWYAPGSEPVVNGTRNINGYITCPDHATVKLRSTLRGDLARLRWTIAHEARHCQLHEQDPWRCGPWSQAEEDLCDAYANARYPEGRRR